MRIWYDFTPDGMCGLYFTASQLQEAKGHVSAICLPLWEETKGHVLQYTSWGEVFPEEMGLYLPFEKELTPPVRTALAMQWKQLQIENAPLRAVVNGRLQSVREDFYDGFIRNDIPEGEFSIATLIGKVLGRQLGIGDWFVFQRINSMI